MNTQLRSRDHRRRLVGGITYLLLDQFTTNAAAPLASPRTCEPGPGTLTLVQTDGQFSIAGNALNFPAQATPAWGDQGFYGAGLARANGRILMGSLNESTVHIGMPIVWARAATVNFLGFANVAHAIYIGGVTGQIDCPQNATSVRPDVGNIAAGTSYSLALVLRSAGAFALIKGGAFSEWSLLWVGDADSTTPVYPAFSNYQAAGTLDNFRVTDLPSPWTDDFGIASQRLAGARTPGDAFTHEANCLIEFVNTTLPAAGFLNTVRFRQQDGSNYWYLRIDSGGTIVLGEQVAGVGNTRGTAAGVLVNGDRVVVVADGTTIRVYEANTLRITYSSATNFQTETDGLLEASTNGVISDIVSWPRTLSGAALSTLSAV